MRKIISEWKYDKLFDKCSEGLGITDKEGNTTYNVEELKTLMARHEELIKKNYFIIGPTYIFGRIKDKIHDYKLRHLSLGKVHYLSKTFEASEFEIVDIPWNLHWQTDTYLLVIIRDYLRNFINNTKAIGNCVYKKEELDPKCEEHYKDQDDDKWDEWKKLVNEVADEFDELYKMQIARYDTWDEFKWQKLKKKAFKDLAFIFDDLSW